MNVLLFGASGATGRELLKQGLAQGHILTAFVRQPSRLAISHTNLRIHQGDVVDRVSVESAISGQDAAVSALGGASLLKRDPALTLGVHNIIMAMEQEGVRRFVYLSADTVRDTRRRLNPFRKVIVSVILHNTAADHEANESMIKQSHLDWIIVRPPMLTNGARTGDYRTGEHLEANSLLPRISRADVAEFMLKQLSENTFLHKAPVVMH